MAALTKKLPPVKAGRQRQTYFYVKLDDKCSYLRSSPGSCKVGVRLLASLSSGHDGNIAAHKSKPTERSGCTMDIHRNFLHLNV